jgi:hypothetical protein
MPHYVTKLGEKKLLAQVARRTCFCFWRWASSLPDGLLNEFYYKKKFKAIGQSA